MAKLDMDQLYVRELTEQEKQTIDSAVMITPMMICPDLAKIKSTGEEIRVTHAYLTMEGLFYGFDTAQGLYSTLNSSEVELINPKYNWKYVAQWNDAR
jgi:hypothetical protein